MQTNTGKLSFWQKTAYGLGDIFGGGSGTLIGFYYLIFLTDVVRISPSLAGTVFLISKAYDAITDPFEGVISDRTRTRLGRRKPYLIAGVPLVFLSFFALFYPASMEREIHRFLFVVFSYLFFSTVVSIVMLNYNALQSEITLDYDERTKLSSFRIFFSTVSSILAALLPMKIVEAFPDIRHGYIAMGLTFGALFAIPFIATILFTKERKEFQKPPEDINLRAAILEPFKVRTFVYALLMYLFAFVAMDTVMTIVAYFMKYHMFRPDEVDIVSGVLLISQVVSLPFYTWLSKKASKQTGFAIGAGVWIFAMLFSFFLGPSTPTFAVYIFAVLVGFGTGGVVVMIYAIFPDLPDVDELKSEERREGIYSSLVGWIRKLSSAFAIFLVANAIDAAGYIAPIEKLVDGAVKMIEQPQSSEFILVLRLIFSIVPIVLVSLSLFFASRYPLTPKVHTRLRNYLAAKRVGEEPEEDGEALSKLLIG